MVDTPSSGRLSSVRHVLCGPENVMHAFVMPRIWICFKEKWVTIMDKLKFFLGLKQVCVLEKTSTYLLCQIIEVWHCLLGWSNYWSVVQPDPEAGLLCLLCHLYSLRIFRFSSSSTCIDVSQWLFVSWSVMWNTNVTVLRWKRDGCKYCKIHVR